MQLLPEKYQIVMNVSKRHAKMLLNLAFSDANTFNLLFTFNKAKGLNMLLLSRTQAFV